VAYLNEQSSPVSSLILAFRCISIDESVYLLENQCILLGHPKAGIRKEVVVHDVILVAMADDENINWPLRVYGPERFLLARCIYEGPVFIIDKNGIAVGIAATADQLHLSFLEIVHHAPFSLPQHDGLEDTASGGAPFKLPIEVLWPDNIDRDRTASRRTSQIMSQAQPRILYLPLSGLALDLLVELVDHAEP